MVFSGVSAHRRWRSLRALKFPNPAQIYTKTDRVVVGEERAKCYYFCVASCQVRYKDAEGIKHECTVQADSLFEAVAAAVREFREKQWCGPPPGPSCEFSVQVQPEVPPQTHTVSLSQVQDFARFGAVQGPKGILRKNRIRELLGITDTP